MIFSRFTVLLVVKTVRIVWGTFYRADNSNWNDIFSLTIYHIFNSVANESWHWEAFTSLLWKDFLFIATKKIKNGKTRYATTWHWMIASWSFHANPERFGSTLFLFHCIKIIILLQKEFKYLHWYTESLVIYLKSMNSKYLLILYRQSYNHFESN